MGRAIRCSRLGQRALLVVALCALAACHLVTGLDEYARGSGAASGGGASSGAGGAGQTTGSGGTGLAGGCDRETTTLAATDDAPLHKTLPYATHPGDALTVSSDLITSVRSIVQTQSYAALGPDSDVTRAELCLYQLAPSGLSTTPTIGVYPVTTAWREDDVTWVWAAAGTLWADEGGDMGAMLDERSVNSADPEGTEVCWDVTTHVRSVVAGNDDFGFLLIAADSVEPEFVSFFSRETPASMPVLRIEHCAP